MERWTAFSNVVTSDSLDLSVAPFDWNRGFDQEDGEFYDWESFYG